MTKRDRVAEEIERCMFAAHELPLPDDVHQKFLVTADRAIAAMGRAMHTDKLSAGKARIIEAQDLLILRQVFHRLNGREDHPLRPGEQQYLADQMRLVLDHLIKSYKEE